MSKRITRNGTKSKPDCCRTCSETIVKNESYFDCFICGCQMHLTKQCTDLNEDAIKGAMALGNNALLVCNVCVDDKQPDKLIKESEMRSEQNHPLQKIEKETADLKKSVSEIKTRLIQNKLADQSDTETAHSAIMTTPAKENLDGIRIRGILER